MNLGNSSAFWIYAIILALGLAILVGGMIFYFSNKNKNRG